MSRRETQPQVIRVRQREVLDAPVAGTRPPAREQGRERQRERERERSPYEDEIRTEFRYPRRNPAFLRDDYDRSDRAPLVRHTREAVRQQPSPDTFDRRSISASRPRPPVISEIYTRSPPLPPPVERGRAWGERRPWAEERIDVRRERAQDIVRYQEVDEVIWDLSRTKDVTLHLELNITQDHELDLDEFCRLGRLGKFHEAKQFFRDNLEQDINDPYVFVQYAQMLLGMGDYKNIKALNVPYCLEKPENLLLHQNWKLIQSISTLRTEGLGVVAIREAAMPAAASVVQDAKHKPPKKKENWKDMPTWTELEKRYVSNKAIEELGYDYDETESHFYITEALDEKAVDELLKLSEKHKPVESELNQSSVFGSTECQILSLWLSVLTHLPRERIDVNWRAIYETLLRQGRIWDLRDILTVAVRYYGQEMACEEFLGSDEAPTNKIITDWSAENYDESTNLALLDTLVSLVLAGPFFPETLVGIRDFVDQAGHVASSIIQHQPSNLKSRQYIRWMLAKVAITNYRDVISSIPLSELPGLFFPIRAVLDPYIYIPVASETPDWGLFCHPIKSNETQQMVLKAARELSDLATEAECLKQLIAQCSDPTEYYNELMHLQKTVQGDLQGWLHTCLSKYIVCRDKPSRDSLRKEILSVSNYTNFDTELVFARCMILRALAQSEQEASLLLAEARNWLLVDAREPLQRFSPTIRSFMERNQLMEANVSQFEPQFADKTATPKEKGDGDLRKGDDEKAYNGATKDWAIVDVPLGTKQVRIDGIQEDAVAEVTWQKYDPVRRHVLRPVHGRLNFDDQREAPVLSPNAGTHETRDRPAVKYRNETLALADQQKEGSSSFRRSEKDSKMETLKPEGSAPLDERDDAANTIHSKQHVQMEDDTSSPPHASGDPYYPDTNKIPPPHGPFSPERSKPERKSPQPLTKNLAQHPWKMQMMRYNNPRDYQRLESSNSGPKQTLSGIYVTINDAATEADVVSLKASEDKEQNKMHEPVNRNLDNVNGTGGNEVEDLTEDWGGLGSTKKSKKKQGIYTRTEPLGRKPDDLIETTANEETKEPVDDWALDWGSFGKKSKRGKKKMEPEPSSPVVLEEPKLDDLTEIAVNEGVKEPVDDWGTGWGSFSTKKSKKVKKKREPEPSSPVVLEEPKLDDLTETAVNEEIKEPVDDWGTGWGSFSTKKSKKVKKKRDPEPSSPVVLEEPKLDDLTEIAVNEEAKEPVDDWGADWGYFGKKSKKDKKKREPEPSSLAEPVNDVLEQERAPESSRSGRPPPVSVQNVHDDFPFGN